MLVRSLAFMAGLVTGSQIGLRANVHRQPGPMPHQFAPLLDHAWRMRYRNPGETLGLFGFEAGMTVLDVGCGTGTFTAEMARMVGVNGMIHAVDLQQPMLNRAKCRLEEIALAGRVQFHRCGAYALPLADSSVDLAVLIAVLGQIPDRLRALAELRRVLKPGGRLAVSEELPDPAYVPPVVVRRWLAKAGLRFGGRSGSNFCYSMIFFNDQ